MKTIDVITVAMKEGDIPFNPFCHFYLASHSEDRSGKLLMSPQLMTDLEIDEAANHLIKEIETARKTAKRELAKARQR